MAKENTTMNTCGMGGKRSKRRMERNRRLGERREGKEETLGGRERWQDVPYSRK